MKILHVFRAPVGGLFRHVVDLARGQIARGHEVGLVCDSSLGGEAADTKLAALAPELALGLTRIGIPRQPGPGDLLALWRVSRIIARTGAEVVHGHGAKGGAFSRLAWSRRSIVRAYTPHGGSLHDGVGLRFHLMVERALVPRGNLYLFESAYSHDVFLHKLAEPAGNARVVHNGVDEGEFAPIEPVAGATDIVFLGELRLLKGVDVLVAAIASLRQTGRDVTATIVGNGPDQDLFRAQAARLAGGAIIFRDAMPCRAALALGKMVVVPSLAESLPYVVLEAAAAGKPVIASRVGGIPEIFGDLANRLVPPGDAGALARAIAEALDNPARAVAEAAMLRERVASDFSVTSMVDGVLDACRDSLEKISAGIRVATPRRDDGLSPPAGASGARRIA